MSDFFLTDPENPSCSRLPTRKRRGYFDFKEGVDFALQALGIPLYYAQTAVIDLKGDLVQAHRDKIEPDQFALTIIDRVRSMYNIASR